MPEKSDLKCEVIIGISKTDPKRDVICKKPAGWYQLVGLTKVRSVLCEMHAEMYRKRGLAVTACIAPEGSPR
jgi:hypothetical protein